MKKYLFIPILLLMSMSAFASDVEVWPFVGASLGFGTNATYNGVFVGDLQAGVSLDTGVFLLPLLTSSLYTGLEINAAKEGFAWAPKIGISQLVGFCIVGVEATFYTPSNFSQLDIRLQPYFGLSLMGIFSVIAGYNFHLHGATLPQVANVRARFLLRLPLPLSRLWF
jgi:hypothetical protein